jgi:hypothetical protein
VDSRFAIIGRHFGPKTFANAVKENGSTSQTRENTGYPVGTLPWCVRPGFPKQARIRLEIKTKILGKVLFGRRALPEQPKPLPVERSSRVFSDGPQVRHKALR